MHAKVLAPLLGHRLQAAQKFPQLRLSPSEHRRVTHHRHCLLPLAAFEHRSVEFATRELEPGSIVEVRRDDQRLIALGFYEPQLGRVDVFDLTPRTVAMLPTVSEDFFIAKLQDSWQRRRRVLHQLQNNTYRISNGAVDGLPSLYVDIFSESFARVVATSAGAERLVPAVVDLLRRSGAEELLLDTPQLGSVGERTRVIAPTIPMPCTYVEGGVRHFWLREGMQAPTVRNRFLLNPAYRRARCMLRELGKGKRVLCVNDRGASATLNAVMGAKHVTVVEEDQEVLEWDRESLISNHTESLFKFCDLVRSSVADLSLKRKCDVAYLECHPDTLNTPAQWSTALKELIKKKIIGVGTVVVMSQESAPLGITDLIPKLSSSSADGSAAMTQSPCSRKELAHLLRSAAAEFSLRVRFLRAFSPSVDFPLLPQEQSVCFTLVYLIEGPVI